MSGPVEGRPDPICDLCGGTGWASHPDPFFDGALIDARCPECERNAHLMWADFGWWTQPNGHKRLLSWNQATKELAFWPLTRWDQPIVLAVIATEDEVRDRLEGWADHNMDGEGLAWLARRLEGCR